MKCVQLYNREIQYCPRGRKTCNTLASSGIFSRVYYLGTQNKQKSEGAALQLVGFEVRHVRRIKYFGPSLIIKFIQMVIIATQIRKELDQIQPCVIGCRAISFLPLVANYCRKTGCEFVYDVHELETETLVSKGIRKYLEKRVERKFIKQASSVVVVNKCISDWYKKEYEISQPFYVRNLPEYLNEIDKNHRNEARLSLGINNDCLVFLYIGMLTSGRGILTIIESFLKSNIKNSKLLIVGSGPLEEVIQMKVHGNPERIILIPAIPESELFKTTILGDIGIIGLDNDAESLSIRLSSPTKMWQYLNAGLAVIAPNIPEAEQLINFEEVGMIYDGTSEGLSQLFSSMKSQDIDKWKENAQKARLKYIWSTDSTQIQQAYTIAAENYRSKKNKEKTLS
jgi:glycosyltransferase involved in cell wall biosynthesis